MSLCLANPRMPSSINSELKHIRCARKLLAACVPGIGLFVVTIQDGLERRAVGALEVGVGAERDLLSSCPSEHYLSLRVRVNDGIFDPRERHSNMGTSNRPDPR